MPHTQHQQLHVRMFSYHYFELGRDT